MSSSTTLILVHAHSAIRVDFDEEGALVHKEVVAATGELGADVRQCLEEGPEPGGEVWVMDGACASRLVDVPTASLDGLDDEELQSTLGYEVEDSTGITAAEGRVGFLELGEVGDATRFWILHVPEAELQAVAEAVREQGAVFRGLLHPGGLGRALASDDAGFWRIEVWPGLVLGVDSLGGAAILGDDVGSARAEIEDWWAEAGGRVEWLASYDVVPPKDAEEICVDEPATQDALLGGWAEELSRDEPLSSPVVLPPPAAVDPRRRRLRTGLIAGGFVIGICAAHAWCVRELAAETRGEHDEVHASVEESTSMRLHLDEIEKTVEMRARRLRELKAEREQKKAAGSAQRRRWSVLLSGLSRHRPADLVVQSIDTADRGVVVSGLCLRPEEPDTLAAALDPELRPLGWKLAPASKRRSSGGVLEFELRMEECELEVEEGAP